MRGPVVFVSGCVVMNDRASQVLPGLEAMRVLRGLQTWQITQLPRRPHARQNSVPDPDRTDLGATQRLQGLVSAFHYGAPVAFGWMREQPGGPVRVLAAGPALAGAGARPTAGRWC